MNQSATAVTREEEIFEAVDQFIDTHHAWTADDRHPFPDASYYDSLQGMVNVCAAGDVPARCRAIIRAVERLDVEYEAVQLLPGRLGTGETVEGVMPHQEFWAAREDLETIRTGPDPFNLPPLESVFELDRQKVPHHQIARIYGWTDKRGEPEFWKVEEELKNPGTHVNDTWRDPRRRDLERKTMDATGRAHMNLRQKQTRAIAEQPCPETPRELFQQGVQPLQASRMLQVPLAEVDRQWAEFYKETGTKPPKDAAAPPADLVAASERQIRENKKRRLVAPSTQTADDLDDGDPDEAAELDHLAGVEEGEDAASTPAAAAAADLLEMVRSVASSNPGMSASDIARSLTAAGTKIDGRKVAGLLRVKR